MDAFTQQGALTVLQCIAALMEENKSRLIELDQMIGDGDLGLTMTAGFSGAAADAAGMQETEPGKLWMKAGMAINKHAPSTMGTLMATGFMRGGKAVAGKETLGSADMAVFFQAFSEGVIERGKAKPGDKTVVDSTIPAAQAAASAVAAGKNLADTLAAVADGAKAGLDQSTQFMSQHGKAAVFREKTIGLTDPGSFAFCLVTQGFVTAVNQD